MMDTVNIIQKIGLMQRLIRSDHPESPRAYVLLASTIALIAILSAVGLACSYRIAFHGEVGMGARWCFGVSVFVLMILGGFNIVKDPKTGSDEVK